MRRVASACLLLLTAGAAFARGHGHHGGVGSAPASPSIQSVSVSPLSFTGGSGAGTVVGAISVTLSSGPFTGSLAIVSTGVDNAGTTCTSTNGTNFKIVGSNLELNTTLAAGSYPGVCVQATQSGATNSPYVQAFTVTGSGGGAGTAMMVERTIGNPAGNTLPASWWWVIGQPYQKGELAGNQSLTGTLAGKSVRVCLDQISGSSPNPKLEADGSQAWNRLIIDGSGVGNGDIAAGSTGTLVLSSNAAAWGTTTHRTNADWEALSDVVQVTNLSAWSGTGADMASANTWKATFDGGATNTIRVVGKSPCGYHVWVIASLVDQTTSTAHAYLQVAMDYLVTEKADTTLGPVASKGPYLLNIQPTKKNAANSLGITQFTYDAALIRNGVTLRSETGIVHPKFDALAMTRSDGQWDWSASDPGIYQYAADHDGVRGYNWVGRTLKAPPYSSTVSYGSSGTPDVQASNVVSAISGSTGIASQASGSIFPTSHGRYYSIAEGRWPLAVSFTGSVPTGLSLGTQYWAVNQIQAQNTFAIYDTLGHALGSAPQVISGGSGYTVGCTIPLSGGTGSAATLTVATISGSAIKTVTVGSGNQGSYSVAPISPVSQSSASCGGTGATFAVPTILSGGNFVVPLTAATCPMTTGQICPTGYTANAMSVRLDAGISSEGKFDPWMPDTGGRPDIGLASEHAAAYLIAGNTTDTQGYLRYGRVNALAETTVPVAWVNDKTAPDGNQHIPCLLDANGCPAGMIGAGQTGSSFTNQYVQDDLSICNGTALLPSGCGTGPYNAVGNWYPNRLHWPQAVYLVWLMEGDEFLRQWLVWNANGWFGENLISVSNINTGDANVCASSSSPGTCYRVLSTTEGVNTRHGAWGKRDTVIAAFVADNGSPEETYFRTDLSYATQIIAWYENYKNNGGANHYSSLGYDVWDDNKPISANLGVALTLAGESTLGYDPAASFFAANLQGDFVFGTIPNDNIAYGLGNLADFLIQQPSNWYNVPSAGSFLNAGGQCPFFATPYRFFPQAHDWNAPSPGSWPVYSEEAIVPTGNDGPLWNQMPNGTVVLQAGGPLYVMPVVGMKFRPINYNAVKGNTGSPYNAAVAPLSDGTDNAITAVSGPNANGSLTLTLFGISTGPATPLGIGGVIVPIVDSATCAGFEGGTAQAPQNTLNGSYGSDGYLTNGIGGLALGCARGSAAACAAYPVANSMAAFHNPNWRNVGIRWGFNPSY